MPFIIDGRRGSRVLTAIAAAVCTVGAFAPAASADEAVSCPTPSFSNPFAQFGDIGAYTLAPGGDMEGGLDGWTLTGAAAVADGNESYSVGSPDDAKSLSLPAGSSATSAPVCVDRTYRLFRFFKRNSGSLLSVLNVDVLYLDHTGVERTLPRFPVWANAAWSPTREIALPAWQFPVDKMVPIRLRFTPASGKWQIDDVYVDPYARG